MAGFPTVINFSEKTVNSIVPGLMHMDRNHIRSFLLGNSDSGETEMSLLVQDRPGKHRVCNANAGHFELAMTDSYLRFKGKHGGINDI